MTHEKIWHPLRDTDYPNGPLLVAAADRETGEVGFFICTAADHGKFFPKRWGPQDTRQGAEWLWLQEDGWTPFAWSEVLPDFPQWPLPPTVGDLEPE